MVQKVPFTSASGNTMTIGTGTSRVVMGADSGNLKIQDSQSNTSVIEAGLGVQGAGGTLVVANNAQLPTSGNDLSAGNIAWSTANSSLFISNGSGWYRITIVNQTPTVTLSKTSFTVSNDNLTLDFTYTASDDVGTPTISVANSGIATTDVATITHTTSNNHIRAVFDGTTDLNATITVTASDGFSQGTGTMTINTGYIAKNSKFTGRLIRSVGANNGKNAYDGTTFVPTNTGSGTVVTTSSGTTGGGPRGSNFSPYRGRGKGYSYYIDGSNPIITFDGSGAIMNGSTSFTAEVWFWPRPDASSWDAIWSGGSDGYNRIGRLYQNGTGLYFYWNGSSSISATNVFTEQQWYHLAVTYDGTTTKIFVNGEQVTTSTSASYSSTGNVLLGHASYGMQGYVHDFRVVKNAVIYTGEFVPPTESLSLYTTGGAVTPILSARRGFMCNEGSAAATLGDVSPGQPSGTSAVSEVRVAPFTPYDRLPYTDSTDGSGSIFFPINTDYTPANYLKFTGTDATVGTSDFCIEFWHMSNYVGTNAFLCFLTVGGDGGTGGLRCYMRGGGYTSTINRYEIYSGASTAYAGHSTIEAEAWRWVHIAIQRNSGTLKMFVNGIEGYSQTDSGNKSNGITIGSSALNYASMAGWIANFRFVKGETVYSGNFNPPTGALTTTGGTYGDGTTNVNTSITASATKILINDWNAAIVDRSQIFDHFTLKADTKSNTGQTKYGSSSIGFDGTGDYIEMHDNRPLFETGNGGTSSMVEPREYPEYQHIYGYDDACIEAWVYVNADANFSIYNQGNTTGGISLYWHGTGGNAGKFQFQVYGGGAGLTTNTYAKQNWYHVAAIRKGRNARLYINGTEDSGARYEGSGNNVTKDNYINIGKIWNGDADNNGYMQDFRFSKNTHVYPFISDKVALTTTNSVRAGATVSNASYTKLLCCTSGTDVTAKTGANAGSIAITNFGSSASTFGPAPGVGSALFRGGDYLRITDSTATKAWQFGTGAFTLEYYIYHRGSIGNAAFNTHMSGLATDAIWLGKTSGNTYLVRRNGNTNDIVGYNYGPYGVFYRRKWHHVAVCRNGSGLMQLFIDGFLWGEDTSASHSYTAGNFNIGTDSGNNYSVADAYISSVRFIQGQALYTNSFTVPGGLLSG
tara:strand:- start:6281 stop:9703 length:3423 start_codon:yes stop_codon:yes gene_type:complete